MTASHDTVLLPYSNIKCTKTPFDREDNNKNRVETARFSRLSLCFPAPLAVNAKCASRTSRPQPLKRITAKMSKACFRRLLHLLPGRQKVKVHARHTHTQKKTRNNVQEKVCTACTKVLANALLSFQPWSKECGPPFAPLGSSSSQL